MRLIRCLLAGLMVGIGFKEIPFGWVIAVFGFVLFAYHFKQFSFKKSRVKNLLRYVFDLFLFALVIELIFFNWIHKPLYLFTDLPYSFGIFIYLVVCILATIYQILLFLPFFLFLNIQKRVKRFDRWFIALIPASLMVLLEQNLPRFIDWTYHFMFLVTESSFATYAGYFGSSTLSFLLFWMISILAGETNKKWFLKTSSAFLFGFMILMLIPKVLPKPNYTEFARVGYVQPNFYFSDPNLEGRLLQTPSLEALLDTSTQIFSSSLDADQKKLDLIVWPESVYSFTREDFSMVQSFSKTIDVPILVPYSERRKGTWYSSSVLVDGDQPLPKPFDKWFLMPFGEYIPFETSFPWVGDVFRKYIMRLSSLGKGYEPTTFELRNGIKLSPMICFDAIDPRLSRAQVRNGSNFMINHANFSWMGNSDAGALFSHINQIRASENGRSTLLVSLTGPSAFFDPEGRELVPRTELLTKDQGWVDVPLAKKDTFYNSYYPWNALSVLFVLCAVGLLRLGRYRKI